MFWRNNLHPPPSSTLLVSEKAPEFSHFTSTLLELGTIDVWTGILQVPRAWLSGMVAGRAIVSFPHIKQQRSRTVPRKAGQRREKLFVKRQPERSQIIFCLLKQRRFFFGSPKDHVLNCFGLLEWPLMLTVAQAYTCQF